jgi:hypothetical protein
VATEKGGDWVSSVTRSGVGRYTINFTASFFSAAPRCFFYPVKAAASFRMVIFPEPTTSDWAVGCQDSADAATDCGFMVICVR